MTTMRGRLTQRDIARIAKVSQTTVSVVLNGRDVPGIRISPETRDRVLKVIRDTGYVADPVARRLADQLNRIVGVFTYERVFPTSSADFYHPFLEGIEEASERINCDLLLFTSSRQAKDRRIFADNRLRLADGTLLLGREIPKDELARLIAEGYPFACLGRRDDAGGPVPYVGADYARATLALARRAQSLGHTELAYLGQGSQAESAADRLSGFHGAGGRLHLADDTLPADELLEQLLHNGITAALVESHQVAEALIAAAGRAGIAVPDDLSVMALGDPFGNTPDRELTGFRIPRRSMGIQAVEVLEQILRGGRRQLQRLLPCELVDGTTLAAPTTKRGTAR